MAVTDISSILCSCKAGGFGTEALLWHPSSPEVHWVTPHGAKVVHHVLVNQHVLVLSSGATTSPLSWVPTRSKEQTQKGWLTTTYGPLISQLQPGPPARALPCVEIRDMEKRVTAQIQCLWCWWPAPAVTAQPRRRLFCFQGHGPALGLQQVKMQRGSRAELGA